MMKKIVTVRLRVKDKHASDLNRQAAAVNVVWNYCNEMQQKAARSHRRWLSDVDLQRLTAGSSKLLDLQSQTICKVCQWYVISRQIGKKPWLKFRGKKSLGWVPFPQRDLKFDGEIFRFRRRNYEVMHAGKHGVIPIGPASHAGSFNRDARGRWYINLSIDMEVAESAADRPAIGIDLGLKTLATLSNGTVIEGLKPYQALEEKLGIVQRARKVRLRRTIHAKIRNQRRDFLHKTSLSIARQYGFIAIGKGHPERIARTSRAKSVRDAAWGTFRDMLSYKAIRHGGRMLEVSERMSTQTCSSCGDKPEGRPIGIAGLGIREWTCGGCGAHHDRDVNAARNILRLGLETLAAGAANERSSQEKLLGSNPRARFLKRTQSPWP